MRSAYDKQMRHDRSFDYFLEKYGLQPKTGKCPSADSCPLSTLLLLEPVLILASLCSALMQWVMLEAHCLHLLLAFSVWLLLLPLLLLSALHAS